MSFDYTLILAAGLGTRMGRIGEELPKILWPVFEKSLLELQILFAIDQGCKKIFINGYHHSEMVQKKISEKFPFVVFHEEKELLGSGGPVHRVNKDIGFKGGSLLILNGDQFLFVSKEILHNLSEKLSEYSSILLSIDVKKNDLYNRLILDEKNLLKEISTPQKDRSRITFSGVSLINLSRLSHVDGPSSFFETVVPFEKSDVFVYVMSGIEYWDFGTKKIYTDSIYRILKLKSENTETQLLNFLISSKAFSLKCFDQKSLVYSSKNFYCDFSKKIISLDGNLRLDKKITWKEYLDDFNYEERVL